MEDLKVIEHVAEICATSNTAADLCRKLVHSPILGEHAVGAVFYIVTQTGDLELIGSYGKAPVIGDDLSIWGSNPLAKSVSDMRPQAELMPNHDGQQYLVSAIPITKGRDPIGVGAIVRTQDGKPITSMLKPESIRALSNTYAIWLDSLGLKPNTGPVTTVADGELTGRQLEVLRQMALGKTNAQIAADLILSESSIRQETVRIYRALGVGTRAEAARKALNLGLIEKVAI